MWNWRLPRPSVEHFAGACVALSLSSGAVEVPLYAAFGIPPVLGAPLMALAGAAGAMALVRLVPRFGVTGAVLAPLGFWLALVLWATLSATWTSAVDLVGGKLGLLLGVSMLFLLLGICVGFAADAFDAFLRTLFAIGLITALAIFIYSNRPPHLDANAAQALQTFTSAYQATTQCVSLAAMVALVRLLSDGGGRFAKPAWGAAWLVLTIATLAGGGRGAAIAGGLAQASVLGFAMFFYWGTPQAARLWRALVALPLLAGLLLLLGSLLELRGIERLTTIANSLTDKTGRHALWAAALAMSDAHPVVGAGLAAFQESANNIESLGIYPHNVFLEVLAENGLAGFALFVGAIVSALAAALRRAREIAFAHGAVWLGLFVYTCFEMNVSGSVTDRMIAFVIGLSAGLAARSLPARSENPSERPLPQP